MTQHTSALDDQALAWLVKINSGQVSPAVEQAFFHWLHTSTAHQTAYLRAEQLWEQSAVIAKLPIIDSTEATPAVTVNEPSTPPRRPQSAVNTAPSKLLLGNWAIAFTALIAVVVLGFYNSQVSFTHSNWVSAIGEQKQISLDDGTRIMLNTNSHLEVDYSRNHRRARLIRGEAYFDVHPNPERPFDVETKQGMVRVLGTHFSVQQQATDSLVTVLEGRVALGAVAASEQAFNALVELRPNQQLSLQEAYQGATPRPINAKAALAWRDKQLVVQKRPLAEVIVELKRYYPITIHLADPALGQREITAVLQIGSLDNTLAVLCQPLNLAPQFSADRSSVTLGPRPQGQN